MHMRRQSCNVLSINLKRKTIFNSVKLCSGSKGAGKNPLITYNQRCPSKET